MRLVTQGPRVQTTAATRSLPRGHHHPHLATWRPLHQSHFLALSQPGRDWKLRLRGGDQLNGWQKWDTDSSLPASSLVLCPPHHGHFTAPGTNCRGRSLAESKDVGSSSALSSICMVLTLSEPWFPHLYTGWVGLSWEHFQG